MACLGCRVGEGADVDHGPHDCQQSYTMVRGLGFEAKGLSVSHVFCVYEGQGFGDSEFNLQGSALRPNNATQSYSASCCVAKLQGKNNSEHTHCNARRSGKNKHTPYILTAGAAEGVDRGGYAEL